METRVKVSREDAENVLVGLQGTSGSWVHRKMIELEKKGVIPAAPVPVELAKQALRNLYIKYKFKGYEEAIDNSFIEGAKLAAKYAENNPRGDLKEIMVAVYAIIAKKSDD